MPKYYVQGLRALLLVALLSIFRSSTAAKLHQAKRSYDSHTYYVLQLDSSKLFAQDPATVADFLGAEHVEQVGNLKDFYLIRGEKSHISHGEKSWQGLEKRAELGERDLVLERYALWSQKKRFSKRDLGLDSSVVRSLERQYPKQRVKRDGFTHPTGYKKPRVFGRQETDDMSFIQRVTNHFGFKDPLWPTQWHLVNGRIKENTINVTGVWDQGIFGTGVNVAIVDDGLDMHSDDLAANFYAEGSWDYNDNTALPEPRLSDDQHGTRCAGEVAAVANNVCGVGIAHKSGIAGIRILSASISDADEAAALNYGYEKTAIFSCSWGPPDDGKSMEEPGRLIKEAMWNGVNNGRDKKGSIFVFASGNGGASDDQCNFDGYTNSLLSITVGAIDRKGNHPYYSEACSAVMVVTYSSGSGDSIHTTDVGKNKCTDRHGGTSAAAPIAAGIFALALEARPELTWRDMQYLCVETAVPVNLDDEEEPWETTENGKRFSNRYGFGNLDAGAFVDAARAWSLVKPQAWWHSDTIQAGNTPLTFEGVTSSIDITADDLKSGNLERLEHVTVVVNISHERRGNIEVELTSPTGRKSVLARERRMDYDEDGMPDWTFMSVKHWGEDGVGTWQLRVFDRQGNGANGTFNNWSINLWGVSIDASKAVPYMFGSRPMRPQLEPTPIEEQATSTTTSYDRPTSQLPEEHASAPPAPVQAGDDDTIVDTGSEPDNTTEEEEYASDPISDPMGYLTAMKNLVGTSAWLFIIGGAIVIFIAGVVTLLILRKQPNRATRGGGYAFAPQTDDEEGLAMSSRSKHRENPNDYDAFKIDSDSEDDSSNDGKTGGLAPFKDKLGSNSASRESLLDRNASETQPFRD